MTLEKRSVPVDVTGGLAKGDDDFASVGLAGLRDARWRLGQQIGKRNGQSDQASSGLPTLGATDRNCIVDLDGVPQILTNEGAFRRNAYDGTWDEMNATAPRPSRIVTSPLVRTNDTLKRPDCAVIGNVLCAVWEDPETVQGFYAFWDVAEDTPRLLAGPKAFVTVTATAPVIDHLRVVAVGPNANAPDRFVVVGRIGSGATADLRQCSYLLTAGTWAFGATTLISVTATASVTVTRDSDGKNFFVAANTGGTARLRKFTHAGALVNSLGMATAANLPVALVHNVVISKLVGIASNGIVTHCADDCSGVATTVIAMTAPASGAPFTFSRAAISIADALGNMWIARSAIGPYAVGSPCCTQAAYLSDAFAVSALSVPGQYVLAGEAFWTALTGAVFCVADQYATGTTVPAVGIIALKQAPVGYYVRPEVIATGSGDNPSFVTTFIQCGRFCQDTEYAFDVDWHLPQMAVDLVYAKTATKPQRWFQCASTGASDGASFAGRKVDLVGSCHYYADPARNVTAQSLRLLANGNGCTMSDGMMVAENTPPCPGYLVIDGFDTGITQATNLYFTTVGITNAKIVIVWRWVDAKGNVHRGAPSSIFTPTALSNGGGNNPAQIVFPTYAPTGLFGDQFTTPEVEVYLSFVGLAGAEFRLVGIVPPKADPNQEGRSYILALNTVALVDANRHGVLMTEGNWSTLGVSAKVRPGLYTDSDELESWNAPPLLDVVSTQSRLWGLSAEGARLNVWYTKPIADGYAPEWSPLLTVTVPQEGGDCVALAALDDKVVALKRRQIFLISGDPGDATGAGSSMQRPRLVSGDVGCVNVNSVVEGPFGVVFQSERGWHSLSRGLELSFIGDRMVSAFDADWTVSDVPLPYVECATIVPSESEVRWAVSDVKGSRKDLVAVWNYLLNKWAISTVFDARSFCVSDGVPWRLGYALVHKETPDSWTGTVSLTQLITFPWLKLNGLAGFQRLWRIVLTFRWYSGSISVQTSTDYAAATETTKTWSDATLLTLSGGSGKVVQLDVRPTVQRCEALRVVVAGLVNTGRGFELVGCQLEIGGKRGAFKKLAAAAKG